MKDLVEDVENGVGLLLIGICIGLLRTSLYSDFLQNGLEFGILRRTLNHNACNQ